MTKKKQQLVEPKLIRIDAKSDLYSVNEVVPEAKCVRRLINIRNNYADLISKHSRRYEVKDNLKVTTSIYNPTLF